MLAPMGIGALYGKRELLDNMQPFLRGGEMIEYVTREDATYAELPHKFEAGTVNAGDAVGLEAAIKYIKNVGFESAVELLGEPVKIYETNVPNLKITTVEDLQLAAAVVLKR